MVSEKNLAFIRSRGGSYIVGTPKAMLRKFEQYLTDKDWHEAEKSDLDDARTFLADHVEIWS